MRWRKVPNDVAESYAYYGLGGWLQAFYIVTLLGLVVSCVDMAYFALTGNTLLIVSGSQWALLSTAVSVVIFLPFLILAPRLHPLTPRVLIAAQVVNCLMTLTHQVVLIRWETVGASEVGGVVGALAVPGITIWYFLVSKRVNATYRHRVPETFAEQAEQGTFYNGALIVPSGNVFSYRAAAFSTLEHAKAHIDHIRGVKA